MNFSDCIILVLKCFSLFSNYGLNNLLASWMNLDFLHFFLRNNIFILCDFPCFNENILLKKSLIKHLNDNKLYENFADAMVLK